MGDPVRFWLQKLAGYRRTDIKWGGARLPNGERIYRKRVSLENASSGKKLKVSYFGSPTKSARYELDTKTGTLTCRPPASYGTGRAYKPSGQRDSYVKSLSKMGALITCRQYRCRKLRYYLMSLRSVVGRSRNFTASCPPSLAQEGTIQLNAIKAPRGREKTVMSVNADFSFNIKGNPYNERRMLHGCYASGSDRHVCYGGLDSVLLYSARTRSSPSVVSGVGYKYIRVYRKNMAEATHVVVMVVPRTKGFVILEIYEADGLGVTVAFSKDPKNKWLPRKDVDLFKVRIPVTPSRKWQKLVVPLSTFVDWNRKRVGCARSIKGVNEDIGDGVLNPLNRESFQFQVILEAEKPGARASAYVGHYVRFVKYVGARTK